MESVRFIVRRNSMYGAGCLSCFCIAGAANFIVLNNGWIFKIGQWCCDKYAFVRDGSSQTCETDDDDDLFLNVLQSVSIHDLCTKGIGLVVDTRKFSFFGDNFVRVRCYLVGKKWKLSLFTIFHVSAFNFFYYFRRNLCTIVTTRVVIIVSIFFYVNRFVNVLSTIFIRDEMRGRGLVS